MTISQQQADRLKELQEQMAESLEEVKMICRKAMSSQEYDRFRYNTLAWLEPGLISGHTWVVDSKPLERVVEDASDEVTEEDEAVES